jgi:8-oxo-dGTP pyrophosphatase MutT (NUDIX family)
MGKIAPWQVLDSTISYEDRWLRVRTDTCITSEGQIIDAWHVMECSTWVNVLALTSVGQVVLVREYRHGVKQVLLGLPGGAVNVPDELPLVAIQRELLEETGYGGGQFFEIGHSYVNPARQDNSVYSFLALDVFQSQEQHLDETENIEIVLQDFLSFSREVWSGGMVLQALYLATLGFATNFILNSDLPQLQAVRSRLL